jgi:hypothetical protein
MRKSSCVDVVRLALLAATGLLATGCGGGTTAAAPGKTASEGSADGDESSADDASGEPVRDGGPSETIDEAMAEAMASTEVGGGCGSHPCVNPTPVFVGDADTGYDTCTGAYPYLRRRAAVTCPVLLPRASHGACTLADGSTSGTGCHSDLDCANDPLGHCELWAPDAGEVESCVCLHGCKVDSDCASGQVCMCGDPVGQCQPASCTSGASCTGGCDCISSTQGENCGPQFDCQTPRDQCSGWADCTLDAAPNTQACVVQNGEHVCQFAQYCGVGRPFIVQGEPRLAPSAHSGEWSHPGVSPDIRSLSPDTRARLAARWTHVGLMEHASIAAFARFTMHLLAIGAPPDLVLASQSATADETEHARLAFALASAYACRDIGPGALAIDGSLDRFDVDGLAAMLVREGCLGETIAAVEALEGAACARDPVVRDVLARIADDETRHAGLAWRALAWLIANGRVDCSRVYAHLMNAISEATAVTDDDDDMSTFGVIGGARRSELVDHAIAQIVCPFAEALAIGVVVKHPEAHANA